MFIKSKNWTYVKVFRCMSRVFGQNDTKVGWFLLRKFDFFNFYMVSSCSILFTDFRKVFVFALGWFFTPSVFFYDLGGNLHWGDLKWPKNHFRVVKRWFWVVECIFWGHISIEKCFCFFRSDTGSAIFRVRKIAFFAFLTHYTRFYAL